MSDDSHQRGFAAIKIVVVKEYDIAEAEAFVRGCELCCPMATIPFDYVLDAIMECDPTVTEYVMCRCAQCPCCSGAIAEKTLIGT